MEHVIPDDSYIMDQNDSFPTCKFPNIPRLSPPVKSLLEISESMDVAILQSKVSTSKPSNHFGPWIPDNKWSPRKQRANRNYRKQVARLILAKRNSSSSAVEFSRTLSLKADEPFDLGANVESSRDAMDPYFKKRPAGPQLRYTTTKSKNNPNPNALPEVNPPTYHQTPSLPTLITLQSPANKNFHTAFSLGKVGYNDSDMTSSVGVPLLLYSKSTGGVSRDTKSASERPENLDDGGIDPVSSKAIENHRSKTSSGIRPSEHYSQCENKENNFNEKTGGEEFNTKYYNSSEIKRSEEAGYNQTMINSGHLSRNLGFRESCADNYNNNYKNNNNNQTANPSFTSSTLNIPYRSGRVYDDHFDMITSPPENPKILKILSQRKPSPPMCEFQDISLHIRHYRMYHTVRFTGRFSLANQPAPQDVKPVQWSEVFPHRPLSVNSASTVPVFRLNVQDFSNSSNNNNPHQTVDKNGEEQTHGGAAEGEKSVSPYIYTTLDAPGDGNINDNINYNKSILEVPGTDEDKPEPGGGNDTTGEDEYKSYRRRSTPNYKDRGVVIDLTPTVTPVLKYKVKSGGSVEVEDHDGGIQIREENESGVSTEDAKKNTSGVEKDSDAKDRSQKRSKDTNRNKFIHSISSRNEKRSTKKQTNLSEDVKIIGNLNLKSSEAMNDTSENESAKKQPQSNPSRSKNVNGEERNTTKVLFSYREFLKRSASNMARVREGLYTPRLRQGRESVLDKRHNEGEWRYPYSRKHAFISILNSDHEMPQQNWRKILIDEDQLKTSIEEKIHDSNIRCNPKKRSPADGGDKFIKFMVKHDSTPDGQMSPEEEKSAPICDLKTKSNSRACREDGGNDVTKILGIVSTYDVNSYDSDTEDIIDTTAEDKETSDDPSKHPKTSDHSLSSVVPSTNKKFWCPKNSRLSAKTRKMNQNTETMRQLVSTPFQNQTVNNSAFVIAVPPPRKGFDDRSVVLPLQDFVQLAMKGNDQTFSNVSKSINTGCKLGISPNMTTIRSASSRRAMDDGLVRVVSFASPVNQFIFAKRITGYNSAARSGFSLPDGTFTDTEQKARSVFQGGFRLRLKDLGVGVGRPKTGNSKDGAEVVNDEEQASVKAVQNNTDLREHNDQDYHLDDECKLDLGNDKIIDYREKKYMDIYIPSEEDDNFYDNNMSTTDGNDFQQTEADETTRVEPKSLELTPGQTSRADKPLSAKEREMSALRKRIVKLAEIRTSSQASDCESIHSPNIYEGRSMSLSTSFDTAQKAGTHGFKLIHGSGNHNWVSNSSGHLADANDNYKHQKSPSISDVTSENDSSGQWHTSSKSVTTDLISQDADEKLSRQQSRFQLRLKAKLKSRRKILTPNTIIHKDNIKADTAYSVESLKHLVVSATESTKGAASATGKSSIVPEGNPIMYSRIVRGSCLKKEAGAEDDVQRPKTVRFKCDGLEYTIVDRNHHKK